MIIRQRTTFVDAFLLKVIFPYLEAGNHRTLMRMARVWRNDISRTSGPEPKQATMSLGLGHLAVWPQQWLRAATRLFQPEQTLAPIPVASRRPSRHRRSFEGKA